MLVPPSYRHLFLLTLVLLGGCSNKATDAPKPAGDEASGSSSSLASDVVTASQGSADKSKIQPQKQFTAPFADQGEETQPSVTGDSNLPKRQVENPRFLADLIDDQQPFHLKTTAPSLDEGKLRVAGIRKLESKHLVLYTDLPAAPAVDELPKVFDLCVDPWCEYFEIQRDKVAEWKLYGCIMKDKTRFQSVGLLPNDVPPFLHGYHRGSQIWVYEQPSEYYRRHLLIHEGTHGFMTYYGGIGPAWYAEGMAEYFGTHRWENGKLQLQINPTDKTTVPYWGRVKLVKDDFAANRGLTLDNALAIDATSFLKPEPYGWSWAAVTFLENHPSTQNPFRKLRSLRDGPAYEFTNHLKKNVSDWSQVAEDWQLMIVDMDYGYDVSRAAVKHSDSVSPVLGAKSVSIAADHGWQSSGLSVQAGTVYQIEAKGRYQVGKTTKPWWCEPNGVTLKYHNGNPLGMLVAALRPQKLVEGAISPLTQAMEVGTGRTFTAPRDGVLYFKINEAASGLSDNDGELQVTISEGSE